MLGVLQGVDQRIVVAELQIEADGAAGQVAIGEQHPLAGEPLQRKGGLGGDGGSAGAGLGAGKGDGVPFFGLGLRLGSDQAAQAGDGLALRAPARRARTETRSRRRAAIAESTCESLWVCKPTTCTGGFKRGHAADQLHRGRQIGRQIQKNDVRLKLPRADIQRLVRRIALQVRQDLKGAGLRKRRQKLLRQLAVRRDQQRRDLRFVLGPWIRIHFFFATGWFGGISPWDPASSGSPWACRYPGLGSLGPRGMVISGRHDHDQIGALTLCRLWI